MMKIRGQGKRIISTLLSILFFTTQGPLMAAEGASLSQKDLSPKTAENQLTLKAALEQAFKSNKTLVTTKNQWLGKGLEIDEVLKKLGAIEVPKEANAEAIALISALNKKQEELKNLELAYEDGLNTMTYNVKVLYYDLLENTEAYATEVENSNKLEAAYLKLYPQYLQGLVKTEVLKANRENYKSSQERQVKTLLAIDQLKAKLTTQLGGIDIGSWTYDGSLADLSISEEVLDLLYPYTVHHSIQLLTLEKDLNTTQTLLEEMNDIYLQAYGDQSKWIYPMLQENQVDYPLLFENFNNMTSSKPKEGLNLVYPLRVGFYKVNALGTYFKEMPKALSLMAEPSPITEALSQREAKRGLVTEGYVTLQKNYRAAYEAYKQLEFDLEKIRETLITDTAILEKLKKSNLKGLSTYSEVQTLMLRVNEEKLRERVLHIKFNKSIAELDFVSAGAVRSLAKLEGFEQVRSDLVPLGKIGENIAGTHQGKVSEEVLWQVKNPVDYFGFEFTLKVPESLKATHYQLFDMEGKAISEPLAINTSLKHENFPYDKDLSLKVILYQKDKILKTGLLEGDKISGRF